MKIEVIDTTEQFQVIVKRDDGTIVKTAPYQGCEYFQADGEQYSLLGPAHGFDKFKLFRLVEVAEV